MIIKPPDKDKSKKELPVFGQPSKIIETTVGRVFFNEVLPQDYGFVNDLLDKKRIGSVIADCYKRFGHHRTVKLLDDVKTLGFHQGHRGRYFHCHVGFDDP